MFDYLAGDVLAGVEPETRDFMVRSSVLDRLSAPLCDAVLERSGSAAVIAEINRENLFLVDHGRLLTPGLDASILPGITRDAVITLAGELGIPVEVRALTRAELYAADEAFFTGTAAEVTPIREVDGYAIGAGKRGPVTKRLQDAFFRAVKGEDPSKSAWLTRV